MATRRPLQAALVLWLAALGTGCGATCDRDPDTAPVEYRDGETDSAAGFYQTSPFEGPYLDFPKGRTYRLFHELGSAPRDIDPYFSFSRTPLPSPDEDRGGGFSNITNGAGNQFLIEHVTDDYIQVRNDTCSDIYLRVTAAFPENTAATTTDAGDGS